MLRRTTATIMAVVLGEASVDARSPAAASTTSGRQAYLAGPNALRLMSQTWTATGPERSTEERSNSGR